MPIQIQATHSAHEFLFGVVDFKGRLYRLLINKDLGRGLRPVRHDCVRVVVSVVVGGLYSTMVSSRLLQAGFCEVNPYSQASIGVLQLRHAVHLRRELDVHRSSDDAKFNHAV